MGKLRDMLGICPEDSPFSKGRKAAEEGRAAPPFPKPDSDWASRLYFRGYQSYNRPPEKS